MKDKQPYRKFYELNGYRFYNLTEEDFVFIKKNYSKVSMEVMAKTLSTSQSTLSKAYAAMKIKKMSEFETPYRKKKNLYIEINGFYFRKSIITNKVLDFIKSNHFLTWEELSQETKISSETLRILYKALGIKKPRINRGNPNGGPKKVPYHDPEVQELIRNPWISNSEIAAKYGVTSDAIRSYRATHRILFYKKQGRSILEAKLALILESLDLAYREKVRIYGKYVDFYLGNKIILEVDGEWAHRDREDLDLERDNYLISFGYKIIRIKEYEIDKAEEIIVSKLKEVFPWTILKKEP